MLVLFIVSKTLQEIWYSEYNADSSISRPLQSNLVYEPSLDRPPSYNEACAAPPYKSPFNKVYLFLFKIYNENRKSKISGWKIMTHIQCGIISAIFYLIFSYNNVLFCIYSCSSGICAWTTTGSSRNSTPIISG